MGDALRAGRPKRFTRVGLSLAGFVALELMRQALRGPVPAG